MLLRRSACSIQFRQPPKFTNYLKILRLSHDFISVLCKATQDPFRYHSENGHRFNILILGIITADAISIGVILSIISSVGAAVPRVDNTYPQNLSKCSRERLRIETFGRGIDQGRGPGACRRQDHGQCFRSRRGAYGTLAKVRWDRRLKPQQEPCAGHGTYAGHKTRAAV
jgi:hypothetical protein